MPKIAFILISTAIVLAFGLLGCQSPGTLTSGIDGAQKATAGLSAYLDSAGKSVAAAAPHADSVGKAHLTDASTSIVGAQGKANETATALGTAEGQNKAKDDEIAKLKADGSSALHAAYGWAGVVGLFIFAGGMAAFYSGIKEAQYVGIGGIILAIGGTALSLAVSAIATVLPWVLGGIGLVIVGALVWSLIKHKGSIAEVIADTKISNQPNVAFTPTTQALVQATSGIVAATPIAASQATSITVESPKAA